MGFGGAMSNNNLGGDHSNQNYVMEGNSLLIAKLQKMVESLQNELTLKNLLLEEIAG